MLENVVARHVATTATTRVHFLDARRVSGVSRFVLAGTARATTIRTFHPSRRARGSDDSNSGREPRLEVSEGETDARLLEVREEPFASGKRDKPEGI